MSFSDVIKKSVLEGFNYSDFSTSRIAITLIEAFLIALFIFFVYKYLTRSTFYNKDFAVAMAVISVITAGILLAMQSNLVISLGMVGALSIVRFRTAIKEPLDIAFLFWSIASGIILAAGMIPLAVIGSVIIGLILLVFVNKKSSRNPYIVVLSCENTEAEKKVTDSLKNQVERFVIKSKSVQKGLIEINAEIRLKNDNTDFINTLSDINGVNSAVLVSYNGEYLS